MSDYDCERVCDALIRKLKEAGFTIRDKEAHEDALKALAESKIVRDNQ
jgi:hypothetical protein